METLSFELPFGETLRFDAVGHAERNDAICAAFVGGPSGSEAWARKVQICVAANAMLDGARRIRRFAEDLLDWAFDEPVWLDLDEGARERLLGLGVVREAQTDGYPTSAR